MLHESTYMRSLDKFMKIEVGRWWLGVGSQYLTGTEFCKMKSSGGVLGMQLFPQCSF